MESYSFRFGIRPDTAPITELIDYEAFCGIKPAQAMRSISPATLLQWRASGMPHQLIDVREAAEYADVNIGGELMPLSEMPAWVGRVSNTLPVVVHCKTGARSARAIQELESLQEFDNLYNLEGGLAAMPL
jgi:adenylyltransferase/sulfurtransferase